MAANSQYRMLLILLVGWAIVVSIVWAVDTLKASSNKGATIETIPPNYVKTNIKPIEMGFVEIVGVKDPVRYLIVKIKKQEYIVFENGRTRNVIGVANYERK